MPVFDVVCRSCRGVFHETNDQDGWIDLDDWKRIRNTFISKFNPKAIANASMFRLKEPYVSYGWTDFPKDPSLTGDALECPQCGAPYPDGAGHVLTRKQEAKRHPESAVAEEVSSDVV